MLSALISSVGANLLNFPTPTEDRDRTVSRRSEPSSRTALNGEQPYPWDLLQPQDAMSRHRGAKPPRRCELLGEISLLSPAYLLSFERWPFHTEPPDHYDRLSSLLDMRPPQSNYPPYIVLKQDNCSQLAIRIFKGGISRLTPLELASEFHRGIFTSTTISLDPWLRQLPSRYAIHAGRYLTDKEFRYLRTVINTHPTYLCRFTISVECSTDLPMLQPTSFDQLFHQPARLTLCHRVGNLGFSALKILTLIIATHACMLTSIRSTTPHRPVSCYAFFKRWLLLSQLPGCHRTLADSLGCSPLDIGFYHPTPDCHGKVYSIRSLIGFALFNAHRFGPPLALTPASTCSWIDHFAGALPAELIPHVVIQPQVLLRLPCYDFTLVTKSTVEGSYFSIPASNEFNSHGVTGGEYKTRERIHRSIADLRLLAIPTSSSRVADYYPNWEIFYEICSTPGRKGHDDLTSSSPSSWLPRQSV
ncbi:hypothetical protein ADUPG1_006317 [Aduncisulcus paluster]|uniref:Uncharacterized protein n=1 Tax=Aduncisulcus paluster TaxID=2918883 RepID=A0ABQ5KHP8_9EUKA|nr:hypothetical protein ADUPG1_006317 [Aduncisulcus paluster]